MARIELNSIRKILKTKNSIHEEVPATYTVFEKNGKKYVQIDTYGRNNRENPEKISQSLQFDIDTAKIIIGILMDEFDL